MMKKIEKILWITFFFAKKYIKYGQFTSDTIHVRIILVKVLDFVFHAKLWFIYFKTLNFLFPSLVCIIIVWISVTGYLYSSMSSSREKKKGKKGKRTLNIYNLTFPPLFFSVKHKKDRQTPTNQPLHFTLLSLREIVLFISDFDFELQIFTLSLVIMLFLVVFLPQSC
jgi:hypothetical protein